MMMIIGGVKGNETEIEKESKRGKEEMGKGEREEGRIYLFVANRKCRCTHAYERAHTHIQAHTRRHTHEMFGWEVKHTII